MRLKSILLLATTSTLVAGIGFFARNSSFGVRPDFDFSEIEANEEEESEAERSIQGALESVYFMRLNEKTQTIEPEWVEAAIAKANRLKLGNRASTLVWENMGPDNIGGRIRAFLIHRDSANIMFASGVSGGLWRSNTAGQSWFPVNDMQENLNVTCMAQTPDGTIFYGTGEGGYTNLSGTRNGSPAFLGNGVYKSTDNRGTKFNRLATTSGSAYTQCNMMVAHPTDNKLFVATENGVYSTVNGGTSWQTLKTGSYKDIAIDKDGIVWIASGSGSIFKSDANGTFSGAPVNTSGTGYAPSGGRTALAISPQDPNTVYTLAAGQYGDAKMVGVYRTTNGGQNWERIINPSSITDVFGPNKQGWYDNVIAVDPENKNRIYMGGVVLATWDNIDGFREIANTVDLPWNTGFIHADKHIITFNMNTKPATMIVGSDGGLYFSQDRNVWTPRNRGLTTLQLYNVAANSLGYITGGSQDNGTNLINFVGNAQGGKPSRNGIEILGGDGFDAEFSKIFPGTIFTSTYYGAVRRTANFGQSSSAFWDDRIKTDDKAADPPGTDFNTTFTLWEDATDSSSRLFLAKNADVWVAINPTDFANPVHWFKVATGLGNDRIIEMDQTPDCDVLFVAKSSNLYRISNLNSANFDITVYPGVNDIPSPINKDEISPNAANGRVITSVNVNQSDKNHVIITLGGYGNSDYVYETKNALAPSPTWKNITGDLPGMPVYDAVVNVDNASHIILATDFGIYETTNGGTSWIEANNGMARVPVFEIRGYEFKPWEGMSLYIGTHGRGFYRSFSLATKTKTVAKKDTKINAYPSPASSIVNIVYTAAMNATAQVEIYGMNGQQYFSQKTQSTAGENTMPVNVSQLPNGYYFARVTVNGTSSTVKFTVAK